MLKYPPSTPFTGLNNSLKTADEPAKTVSKHEMDFRKFLELQVGKTGEVNTEYGGFEIKVLEPAYFPWYDCLATLIKYGYEVWVSKKKDFLFIVAKPASD